MYNYYILSSFNWLWSTSEMTMITFLQNVFMWDYFMVGVALSIMRNSANDNGENEFAVMEYMNITVVTSNEPYGISDGSNPFNDGSTTSKFKNGVHSGHVQTGNRDPFCLEKNQKGRCKVCCFFSC